MAKNTDQNRRDLQARIASLEEARAYLAAGEHADWRGFRALFAPKIRDGRELPPHRDWVKNVFLPRQQKALNRAERLLERFSET